MNQSILSLRTLAIALLFGSTLLACGRPGQNEATGQQSQGATAEQAPNTAPVTLTLVSYAVTRSAYEKIIPLFVEAWRAETGQTVTIEQSYGGSGSQARAVIDGLEADIVALALASDINQIAEAGLIEPEWETEAPNDSVITQSVIAIVPRDPNLKITKWTDLAADDLEVITANPKTSGGARWNFLGLWGAIAQTGGTEAEAREFVTKIYKNAPILPKNARESTDVFYQQGQGDVLLNYENEIVLANQQGANQPYTILTDYNISIDNPVAIVDQTVDKKNTRAVAEAFIEFLYTPAAQKIFAETGFRPIDPAIAAQFTDQYPAIKQLATIEDFGGWQKAQPEFFDDGAIFDQIFQ
ncbi:sulfate ABC transporter substrate-binding protein [Synechococcus moorigangaii CMS01]|nr:sulfate ABC transporter substrate-binding protein [Synechococcus moorigangaii CMS01]